MNELTCFPESICDFRNRRKPLLFHQMGEQGLEMSRGSAHRESEYVSPIFGRIGDRTQTRDCGALPPVRARGIKDGDDTQPKMRSIRLTTSFILSRSP
jgi:hypothetical protein